MLNYPPPIGEVPVWPGWSPASLGPRSWEFPCRVRRDSNYPKWGSATLAVTRGRVPAITGKRCIEFLICRAMGTVSKLRGVLPKPQLSRYVRKLDGDHSRAGVTSTLEKHSSSPPKWNGLHHSLLDVSLFHNCGLAPPASISVPSTV